MSESMLPKNRIIWTESSVIQEALKYSSRRDFRQFAAGAYAFASRENILDKVCSHMTKAVAPTKWDEVTLKREAQKYKTTHEFRKNDSNAYSAAKKKGILEYVCSHMEAHKNARKKPLKKLSAVARSELKEINEGRIKIGFKPLEVKVRTCIVCRVDFESTGDRTCGCNKDHMPLASFAGSFGLTSEY